MKTVYLCFSTDIIHSGHINIINRAAEYGTVIAGVLTNEVVASIDRFPLTSLEERMKVIKSINGISRVVVQDTLYYDKVLDELKPDYVAHGDDWIDNELSYVREQVVKKLAEYGGQLLEFPYTYQESLTELEQAMKERLGIPEVRRARLRKMLNRYNRPLCFMEAHSGLSALIVEHTRVEVGQIVKQFDGMWISSLCDSTLKGKPDIELVDLTSRLKTIDEVMEVSTKPIIFDGDTGGLVEHFVYTVKTLERIGVSAVIIEDKIGLKRNSLFGTDAKQKQAEIEDFCYKIAEGKRRLKTKEFMIIARIESLILQVGIEDALKRAFAYVQAGADGIMIHSREKSPQEVFEFCDRFRSVDKETPIVVVPTTYGSTHENELYEHGANIVIYANHLIRSAFPAMKKTAELILKDGCCSAVDQECMPIKDILTLIPEE